MSKPSVPPFVVIKIAKKIRGFIGSVHRRMVPKHIAVMEMIASLRSVQAICVFARLGVPDLLQDGELSSNELAEKLRSNPENLYRLLRAIASENLLEETKDGIFRLTSLGQLLRSDVKNSVRDIAVFQGQFNWSHWGELYHAIQSGQPAVEKVRGKPFFDYIDENADARTSFNLAMGSYTQFECDPIIASYDFSKFSTVMDIGGGEGRLISSILAVNPKLEGVLFDLPESILRAKKRIIQQDLNQRLKMIEGSFFDFIPKGADAYILKHVLHDWTDDDAVRILQNIRQAIPKNGRLIIIEALVPGKNEFHPSKMLDLEMMVVCSGRERTLFQFETLLNRAEFSVSRISPTVAMSCIIEAKTSLSSNQT
jgi:SAM-dependent methyltransferase